MDQKTSHKCQFFKIAMYASSESRINDISIDVWFVMIRQYLVNLESEDAKIYINIEKIIFKVVQIKFLAMRIINQKLSFDIFTVQNIFMKHDLNI